MKEQSIKKLIVLLGAAANHPTTVEPSSFSRSAMQTIFSWVANNIYTDAQNVCAFLAKEGNDVEWVIVRPPGLTNGPKTGVYRVDKFLGLGVLATISRADLAEFMVKVATDGGEFGKWRFEAPMVA
ncbi:hypothetical protein HK102_008643, partial [Quaeritorhiza haematococci]